MIIKAAKSSLLCFWCDAILPPAPSRPAAPLLVVVLSMDIHAEGSLCVHTQLRELLRAVGARCTLCVSQDREGARPKLGGQRKANGKYLGCVAEKASNFSALIQGVGGYFSPVSTAGTLESSMGGKEREKRNTPVPSPKQQATAAVLEEKTPGAEMPVIRISTETAAMLLHLAHLVVVTDLLLEVTCCQPPSWHHRFYEAPSFFEQPSVVFSVGLGACERSTRTRTYSLVPNSHEIKGIPLPQMMDNLGIEEGKEQMDIDA
ncbi:hypothetical protein Anapl_07008 [Anas platyrhynchos]|uniref:Uncharacterized protein n=1 Tax=Anas platyrhynchos TaxID=8839 RepID=R0LS10_ANAPL|nr:hypothetical protein Anapl_07008 [Anas platyrhynchos]